MKIVKRLLFLVLGASITYGIYAGVVMWGADFAAVLLFILFSMFFGAVVKYFWEARRG